MRADALRALAAQYRSLAVVYPGFDYEAVAEECEQEALKLEGVWAAEDAKVLIDMEDVDV